MLTLKSPLSGTGWDLRGEKGQRRKKGEKNKQSSGKKSGKGQKRKRIMGEEAAGIRRGIKMDELEEER